MKRLALALALAAVCGSAARAGVTRYISGNQANVSPQTFGPVLNLGGGGTDVDPAIQWMIDSVRGCTDCAAKVDVVVLRSSGSNGYNAPILAMNGVDSVETLVITDSKKTAMDSVIVGVIRNAEVIFFAGGDQCDYVSFFRKNSIRRAIASVYARGGAIGGTSAGQMIQGEFVYDSCTGSATSSQALSDPYAAAISFTYDFFGWNHLQSTIADSHFFQRDRFGRLFTFLARQIKDGRSSTALGVAANERTSVVVDKNGLATVMGNGTGRAYFVLADHMPETCMPGIPLTYSNFRIWRVEQGQTFNLRNRPADGFYTISVNNGIVSGSPY